MAVASVTVTKTNISLAPGQTDFLEAKVNHDDGRSDYNYRVVVRPEAVAQVTHAGAQVVVRAGTGGGQAVLRVVSNHNPQIAAEVKILVAGQAAERSTPRVAVPPPVVKPQPPVAPVQNSSPASSLEKEEEPTLSFAKRGEGEFSSNSQFIDRLYREILHRPADAAGRAYWTRMLDKNLYTRDEARQAFLESPEANRTSAQ